MSGKNGGIKQIYNIVGGRDCHTSSGEWFHVLKAGSGKSVICAAPRSTIKDVEEARDEAVKALSGRREVSLLWADAVKMFYAFLVDSINNGKVVLADAAADESGLDKYEIIKELEKIKFSREPYLGPLASGGEIKVMEVGGVAGTRSSFYSTIIFSVLYELLNRSAVIMISSKANVFCYYFGKIVSNAAKKANMPAGIFGLIYAKDGKLAEDVLGEIIDGKFYKIGNGIVVPRRK